jgi:hypothetical protein
MLSAVRAYSEKPLAWHKLTLPVLLLPLLLLLFSKNSADILPAIDAAAVPGVNALLLLLLLLLLRLLVQQPCTN